MKASEFVTEAVKQRLDPKCWKGKHKEGTKIKGGVRVNNCVPKESVELDEIDRRGFLKGAGAALGATALGAVSGQAKADTHGLLNSVLGLYYICNRFQNPTTQGILVRLKKSLSKFSVSYPNGKAILNSMYPQIREIWQDTEKNDPEKFNRLANGMISKANDFITELDSLTEFSESKELDEEFDLIESIINQIAEHNQVDAEVIWEDLESLTEDELYAFAVTSQLNEDWQKVNKKDKTDGMSKKAVSAYRREHPGSKLKTAVTTKPSKLKKGSKASKRRKSYCSRSKGQMKMHNISCAKTPDKAICKARRRWNC